MKNKLLSLFKKKENTKTCFNDYNKQFTEPFGKITNDGFNNMILSQNVFLSMNSRQTCKNNNVFVFAGAGSGKGRCFIKPNLLQANSNYVVIDNNGEYLQSTGKFLEQEGYEIKILNLKEMGKSDKYNPFHYLRDEEDVLIMVRNFIKNTNPNLNDTGDPFFAKSEEALLQALIFYLIKYKPKEEQTFTSIIKLLQDAYFDEENPKSKLDEIFEKIEKEDPNSIALKHYKIFQIGSGKSKKGILISTSIRLTFFNLEQVQNLTNEDTIDLYSMGEGKKALFIITPIADTTFNFLGALFLSQLFDTLRSVAETKENCRLERPVRLLLDDFTYIGYINDLAKNLSITGKYNISCTFIAHNLLNVKAIYKDEWESIVGCCDSFLYLGSRDFETLSYLSQTIGYEELISYDHKNKNKLKGYNPKVRYCMTLDGICRMESTDCVLLIRGMKQFKDKKYEYTKHKNYPYTADANKENEYVISKETSKN